MTFATLGVLSSDPNLLACELLRLEGTVGLGETGEGWHAGLGSYAQDTVLLKAFPPSEVPRALHTLEPDRESPVLLFHAQPGAEQPLRYRPWLFAVGGALPREPRWRESWTADLPDYLRKQVAAWGPAEAVFAGFLKGLRDIGQTEDPRLGAPAAAEVLAGIARRLADQDVTLLATNGRLLLGARTGAAPLYWRLLEGTGTCERHRLGAAHAHEGDPRVLAHRKARALVIASHPTVQRGWAPIATGQALAADERLALHWHPPQKNDASSTIS